MPNRILIVEDDALIAMTLAQDLEDAGFEIAGPCLNVPQALHTLQERKIDAAVLDLQLGATTSAEIAMTLKTAQIPFVVASGYADDALEPPFDGATTLNKPVQLAELIAVLRDFGTS